MTPSAQGSTHPLTKYIRWGRGEGEGWSCGHFAELVALTWTTGMAEKSTLGGASTRQRSRAFQLHAGRGSRGKAEWEGGHYQEWYMKPLPR